MWISGAHLELSDNICVYVLFRGETPFRTYYQSFLTSQQEMTGTFIGHGT